MLISYSHQFLFIHVYKVAGTSIRRALAPFAHRPEQKLVNRMLRKLGRDSGLPLSRYRVFPPHAKARELQARLPADVFTDFFKFAFVRNPWDWQVSLYHYMLQKDTHGQNPLVEAFESFDAYVEWRVSEDLWLQKEFVTDERGRLLVDFVGRFERLEGDFGRVCRKLGIETELPYVNPSSHRDYRTYYSAHSRRLIEEHFAEDIELFEYEFDRG